MMSYGGTDNGGGIDVDVDDNDMTLAAPPPPPLHRRIHDLAELVIGLARGDLRIYRHT